MTQNVSVCIDKLKLLSSMGFQEFPLIHGVLLLFLLSQEELEWFERKQRGKKRRPRKQKEETIEPSWFQRHSLTMLMLSVAVGLIAGLFFIAMN